MNYEEDITSHSLNDNLISSVKFHKSSSSKLRRHSLKLTKKKDISVLEKRMEEEKLNKLPLVKPDIIEGESPITYGAKTMLPPALYKLDYINGNIDNQHGCIHS